MSRRCCTLCGGAGHNKRNRDCPVNVQLRAEADAIRMALQRSTACFMDAQANMCDISETIRKWQRGQMTTHDFVSRMIQLMEFVCNNINIAAQGNMYVEFMINSLYGAVHIMNQALRRSPTNNNEFFLNYIDDEVFLYIKQIVKQTTAAAYLKSISLVQDLTISNEIPGCDCPICFDEFAATDVLQTNCNHSFCISCIKNLSNSIKNKTNKPCCPMCRTEITKITIGSTETYNELNDFMCSL